MSHQIQFKKLVWEQGESIVHGFKDPIFVSIHDLVEFAIIDTWDEDYEVIFKLEITFGGGHWDCFLFDSIVEAQAKAQEWVEAQLTQFIETPKTDAQ